MRGGVIDYKFFCFHGEVKLLYIVKDHKIGFYDTEFKQLPICRTDYLPPLTKQIEKPQNYEEMLSIVQSLSKRFPHVRVDLYNVIGKIIFGELTFFSGSGYMTFEPDAFDFKMGQKWEKNF